MLHAAVRRALLKAPARGARGAALSPRTMRAIAVNSVRMSLHDAVWRRRHRDGDDASTAGRSPVRRDRRRTWLAVTFERATLHVRALCRRAHPPRRGGPVARRVDVATRDAQLDRDLDVASSTWTTRRRGLARDAARCASTVDDDGVRVATTRTARGATRSARRCRGGSHRVLRRVLRDDERLCGLGEQAARARPHGRAYRLWNRDPGGSWGTGQDPLYCSMPDHRRPARDRAGVGVPRELLRGRRRRRPRRPRATHGVTVDFHDGALVTYVAVGELDELLTTAAPLLGAPRDAASVGARLPPLPVGVARPTPSVAGVLDGLRRARASQLSALHLDIDHMDRFRVFTFDAARLRRRRRPRVRTACESGTRLVAIVDPAVRRDTGFALYDEGVDGDALRPSSRTAASSTGRCGRDGPRSPTSRAPRRARGGRPSTTTLTVAGHRGGVARHERADVDHPVGRPDAATRRACTTSTVGRARTPRRTTSTGCSWTRPATRRWRRAERAAVRAVAVRVGGDRAVRVALDRRRRELDRGPRASRSRRSSASASRRCRSRARTSAGSPAIPSPGLYVRWLELGVVSPFCRTHCVLGVAGPRAVAVPRAVRRRDRAADRGCATGCSRTCTASPKRRTASATRCCARRTGPSAARRAGRGADATRSCLGDELLVVPVADPDADEVDGPRPGRAVATAAAVRAARRRPRQPRTIVEGAARRDPRRAARPARRAAARRARSSCSTTPGATARDDARRRARRASAGRCTCYLDERGDAHGRRASRTQGTATGPTRRDAYAASTTGRTLTVTWSTSGDFERRGPVGVVVHGRSAATATADGAAAATEVDRDGTTILLEGAFERLEIHLD